MPRVTGANPPQPYLSVWNPSEKAIRSSQFVAVNFISPGLDINCNEFPFVPCFNGTKLILIDRITAASELFFGVTWLGIHSGPSFDGSFNIHQLRQTYEPACG